MDNSRFATHLPCPHCGRPMLPNFRFGLRLGPVKAKLLDRVKACEGISIYELASDLGKSVPTTLVHITQLNHLIEDVGWKIKGHSPGYRLDKV